MEGETTTRGWMPGSSRGQMAAAAAVIGVGLGVGIGTAIVYTRLNRKARGGDFAGIRNEVDILKREVLVLRGEIEQLRSALDLKLVYEKVDTFLQSNDEPSRRAAYDLMTGIAARHATDADFLWRFARACHLYGGCFLKVNEERRKALIFQGWDVAKKALLIDDTNADVFKWLAVTSGVATDFLPLKEKIKEGYHFKEYVDRALSLRYDDEILLHMRGRWSYSVAQLSWIERKVASTLFAAPPTATVDDALRDFLEAERVKPNAWIENLLYVAKCYMALSDVASALPYLRTACSGLPVTDAGDQQALEEARYLLGRHG